MTFLAGLFCGWLLYGLASVLMAWRARPRFYGIPRARRRGQRRGRRGF